MIYTLENYQDLNSLYLHDSELKDIIVDYNSKELIINLLDSDKKKYSFNIKFYFFFIECFEPWGEGIYIDSFSIAHHCHESGIECIKMELLLNSGDKLKILAKEICTKISSK